MSRNEAHLSSTVSSIRRLFGGKVNKANRVNDIRRLFGNGCAKDDSEFEGKHAREGNGKFASGGGGNSSENDDIKLSGSTDVKVRTPLRGSNDVTVLLPHEAHDINKIKALRKSMLRDGWEGRPVIMANTGDNLTAFTGVHRLSAIAGTDIKPEVAWLPENLTEDDWDKLNSSNDDDDRVNAMSEIVEDMRERGDDEDDIDAMEECLSIMRQEVEANG